MAATVCAILSATVGTPRILTPRPPGLSISTIRTGGGNSRSRTTLIRSSGSSRELRLTIKRTQTTRPFRSTRITGLHH
jgi:hypothetical protein